MSNMKEDEQLVRGHLNQMMEYFDSVHIFVTRHEEDGTMAYSCGSGNYYARKGQVSDWILRSVEDVKKEYRDDS